MKYFELTAYTPYCGEELTEYAKAVSEEELYTSGKIDNLIDDCVSSYMDSSDWESYNFDSEEDFVDYYYEDSGVNIREISEDEYVEALGHLVNNR